MKKLCHKVIKLGPHVDPDETIIPTGDLPGLYTVAMNEHLGIFVKFEAYRIFITGYQNGYGREQEKMFSSSIRT